MRYLRQNTAITVLIGLLIDWRDARTPLTDNDLFDPTNLTCRVADGEGLNYTLTLTKTGGENNINLDGYGSATLALTAENTETPGELRIAVLNAIAGDVSSDLILPIVAQFCVLPEAVYDAMIAGTTSLGVNAAAIITALKAATGFTAGGSMTFAEIVKVLVGNAAGDVRLKAGTVDTLEFLDADDGETVVMELRASESTPFRQVALP